MPDLRNTIYIKEIMGNQSIPQMLGSENLPGSPLIDQMSGRGAIYTRRDVVEFILDMAGYTEDQPLYSKHILEPSCGEGDFLRVIVKRLINSYRSSPSFGNNIVSDLRQCVTGIELHQESLLKTHHNLIAMLREAGLSDNESEQLSNGWLIQGDFLLIELPHKFDFVVGNPPYVRQELIPDNLLVEYRKRYITLFDRADLYIPFIEHGLASLAKQGILSYICSDRWTKNRYGGPLRKLVAQRYHLKYYVDMVNTPAFLSEVMAYPSIFIIANESPGPTRVAHSSINRESLVYLAKELMEPALDKAWGIEISDVTSYSQPWILESFDQLSLVRRLEQTLPSIEETGCKIGIGVATGADNIFIGQCNNLDVEPDCKIPLLMTKDILDGKVNWHGNCVINPFRPNGALLELADYPRLDKYLISHQDTLLRRHVAKKSPKSWFRTIDRINPALTSRPKLLIPDIKGFANVVLEDGHFYPHHNLYYIVSDYWDLRALQAVLISGIARLFISIYSTKMNGGCFRFQAQYLKRIRIPNWNNVPESIRTELINASTSHDISLCNSATYKLFGLSQSESRLVDGNDDRGMCLC